jgi:putative MATE family efflux protein
LGQSVSARAPQQRDLTSGVLGKQILMLSLPSTAEMALFSATELVHAFWMGRLGGTALAAASMSQTLRLVLISPMMGLSVGGMAIVARCVGARDQREADRATMQTILLIMLFTLPLVVLGVGLGGLFLRWMGARDTVWTDAVAYLRIILAGLFFMECLPTLNAVIRGAGYPEYTLRINVASIAVMMVAEPVLVLGFGPVPGFGVRGAAWAAVLSSAVGVIGQAVTLLKGSAGLRLHLADLRPDLRMMRRILRIAVPTSVQRFSPNLTNALLMALVSSFGNNVLTAYSILTRLMSFLQAPAFGLGIAAATMVGQNLGASEPARAERATVVATLASFVLSVLLFGLLAIVPGPALALFSSTGAVLAAGIAAVPFYLLVATTSGWAQVVGSALGGAGDTVAWMWINIGSLWLVQLPLSWALSIALRLGPVGIWLGVSISFMINAGALTVRFMRGRWKLVAI